MRPAIIAVLLLASCNREDAERAPQAGKEAVSEGTQDSSWELVSSGEGTALIIEERGGPAGIRLFCPAGSGQILVNVPSFNRIGSEERLSFGQGGEVVALVADPQGDRLRGGVSGEGRVPPNLLALLSGNMAVSYGSQVSGPHPAPPADLARGFAAACADGPSREGDGTQLPATPAPGNPQAPAAQASACRVQDGEPVPANAIRAIGTEPFWGARVEGRCVTYSHPEDQAGTRVWTKFSGTAANGTWTGALGGKPFMMRTRPQPGCSDGMSDRRYPIAVSLTVSGEQRSGCAEPL